MPFPSPIPRRTRPVFGLFPLTRFCEQGNFSGDRRVLRGAVDGRRLPPVPAGPGGSRTERWSGILKEMVMVAKVTKRDFLRLAGMGGVVFASSLPGVAGRALAAGMAMEEFYFVQLSDLH